MQSAETLDPSLRLCRQDFNGAIQVCLLIGEREGRLVVRKWRSAAQRWTTPVTIPKTDLRGTPTPEVCRRHGVDMSKL